ncbi:MAG: hypothetical protein OHK0039_17460 [Bacteroidia bacterium]
MTFLRNIRFYVLGAVLGALAGYVYWDQVGCLGGQCLITSTWERMVPYGALMGSLLGGMLHDWVDKPRPRKEA